MLKLDMKIEIQGRDVRREKGSLSKKCFEKRGVGIDHWRAWRLLNELSFQR